VTTWPHLTRQAAVCQEVQLLIHAALTSVMNCGNRTYWESSAGQSTADQLTETPRFTKHKHQLPCSFWVLPREQYVLTTSDHPFRSRIWATLQSVLLQNTLRCHSPLGWKQTKNTSRLLKWRQSTTWAIASALLQPPSHRLHNN